MVLAVFDHRIGAGVSKDANHIGMTAEDRQMERRDVGVPVRPEAVRRRAVIEEPTRDARVATLGREVEYAARWLEQPRIAADETLRGLPVVKRECGEEIERLCPRCALAAFRAPQLGGGHCPNAFHHGAIGIRTHRVCRGRKPVGVGGERIGAELDEERDHRGPAHPNREVERRRMILVPAHPSIQRRGIGGDEPSQLVASVHGDEREDVVPRAMPDERVSDGAMGVVVASLPARRPADHLEAMVVARANDIRSGIDELSHDVAVASRGRPVHRVRVVATLTGVDVESPREEQLDDSRSPVVGGDMQQRPRIGWLRDVQLLRMGVEQRA